MRTLIKEKEKMKLLLKTFVVIALTGSVVLPVVADDAKDQKDLKKVVQDESINYVETAQKGITLSGYVDTSYTYQFASKGQYGSTGGSSPNSEAQLRQFDVSNNTFNINAVKIALEKALPDKNEWAAGFRLDTIYGEDARFLGDTAINGVTPTSTGTINNSGIALEQALVKFRIPVGNGLDIYMGKFVTFLGYEVIESPANLNFSRGLLFTNAIPLTHTGIYADYKFNDTIETKFGIVDGWNNSTSPSVGIASGAGTLADSKSFGKAITGQVTINAPGKNANITQSFIYSPEGEPGVIGVDNGPVVVYDIWGNWNPTFVKDNALLLGFNIDLGYNGASGFPAHSTLVEEQPAGGVQDSNTWWGIALYSQYKFNKMFSLAGRAEYLHSDQARFPKFGDQNNTDPDGDEFVPQNQDDFSYTLTASFNIWDNLLTRVEYRYDHFNPGLSGDNQPRTSDIEAGLLYHSTDQNEISINMVYSF
jgi:hypothetical protein